MWRRNNEEHTSPFHEILTLFPANFVKRQTKSLLSSFQEVAKVTSFSLFWRWTNSMSICNDTSAALRSPWTRSMIMVRVNMSNVTVGVSRSHQDRYVDVKRNRLHAKWNEEEDECHHQSRVFDDQSNKEKKVHWGMRPVFPAHRTIECVNLTRMLNCPSNSNSDADSWLNCKPIAKVLLIPCGSDDQSGSWSASTWKDKLFLSFRSIRMHRLKNRVSRHGDRSRLFRKKTNYLLKGQYRSTHVG